MGEPFHLARPVVTVQMKSGMLSSVDSVCSNPSKRSSSVVSTAIIGLRELISNLNSSCFWALTATRGCVEEAAIGETTLLILPALSFISLGKRNLPRTGLQTQQSLARKSPGKDYQT